MDKELEYRKQRRRQKRMNMISSEKEVEKKPRVKDHVVPFITRFLITVVLTLITLIALKTNTKWKTIFYKHVYDTNFSFATVNNLYQSYFGSPIPFKGLVKTPIETVFNEKLVYKEANIYQDGAKLTVSKNYLVPILESGMVVFVGNKEGYGNTVIIQGVNGVDTWYGNVTNVNVKLYDYVSKGSLLGEASDTALYLVFQKEGKALNYKDYIK